MSGAAPVVSVVMPVYNAERFLAKAVDSVLSQSFSQWELLMIDDASTDGSLRVAAEYAGKDPRIRVIRNESNYGVSETRNRGIREAKGQWIALLDSDDYWLPEKLDSQLALDDESGAEIIYCSYSIVDENDAPCCNDFIVPPETDFHEALVRSLISCSTALIQRNLLLVYPFSSAYSHEDLILWISLLKAGYQARGCREVLAAYRLSEQSRSGNKRKAAWGRWRIYRKYLKLPLIQSCALFAQYSFSALKKYVRI